MHGVCVCVCSYKSGLVGRCGGRSGGRGEVGVDILQFMLHVKCVTHASVSRCCPGAVAQPAFYIPHRVGRVHVRDE